MKRNQLSTVMSSLVPEDKYASMHSFQTELKIYHIEGHKNDIGTNFSNQPVFVQNKQMKLPANTILARTFNCGGIKEYISV